MKCHTVVLSIELSHDPDRRILDFRRARFFVNCESDFMRVFRGQAVKDHDAKQGAITGACAILSHTATVAQIELNDDGSF
jgi:hypothetical protein